MLLLFFVLFFFFLLALLPDYEKEQDNEDEMKSAKPLTQTNPVPSARVLVLVDESNVLSSVRAVARNLDWLKLRDFLVRPSDGRTLIEMVVYAGLPPAMPEWQAERDKKNKFL